jgi:hypothetical protein
MLGRKPKPTGGEVTAMNQSFKGFFLLGAFLTFASQALPKNRNVNDGAIPPKISVRVHNYAQASSEVLIRAEAAAAEILGNAGIEITWSNCDPARADHDEPAGCNKVLGPTSLAVRILPQFGIIPGTSRRTMGVAAGYLASVSIRRVKEEAIEFGVQPCEVLGPAIAHEIGHLLLGQQGHSPSGIMRARWRREDYERAPQGAFKFTAGQAQSICTEVRSRVQEQGPAEVAIMTAAR